MARRVRVRGYFEEYACGCVSQIVRYKKDLVGYCAKHGSDRRKVWPDVEWPNAALCNPAEDAGGAHGKQPN